MPLSKMAVLYRNHHDSILLQAELVARGISYTMRSGLRFFEQAHVKDVLAFPAASWPTPATSRPGGDCCSCCPGIGPAKGVGDLHPPDRRGPRPAQAALATAETMALVPVKTQGPLRRDSSPTSARSRKTNPESNPADGHRRDPQGGVSRDRPGSRYERPDNRIADIEQLAVLASRYDQPGAADRRP